MSRCWVPRTGYADREQKEDLDALAYLLTSFHYQDADPAGAGESELCPMLSATVSGSLRLNPNEVIESRWVEPAELHVRMAAAFWVLSWWMLRQVSEILSSGGRHQCMELGQR